MYVCDVLNTYVSSLKATIGSKRVVGYLTIIAWHTIYVQYIHDVFVLFCGYHVFWGA